MGKQEGNEGILTITIPSEELDTALDDLKVSKDVSLPDSACSTTSNVENVLVLNHYTKML